MDASAPNISSSKELEKWLEDRPVEWAQAIAVRAALRVFPLVLSVADISDDALAPEQKQRLILHAWRAMLISWAARKYPAHDMRATATVAAATVAAATDAAAYAAAADAAAATAAAYATDAAATDAAAAATAAAAADAAAATTAAYATVAAATYAAATAAKVVWAAISEDCRWLERGNAGLIDQPLWLMDVHGNEKYGANYPDWARQALKAFVRSDWVSSGPWGVVGDWYRAILPNDMNDKPRSLFGERIDIDIATRPDEFWDRDPLEVMKEVAEIADIGGRNDPRLEEMAANLGSKLETTSSTLDEGADELRWRAKTARERERVDDRERDTGDSKEIVRTETELQSDQPEGDEDHLGRADIAFMLANRLQQIWNHQRTLPEDAPSPSFVVHVDAPWGGGKSTFANFLVRLLSPDSAEDGVEHWKKDLPQERLAFWRDRLPWHVVDFNAWQKQHVRPPWWVFYRGLHRQTLSAVRRGDFWKRTTPERHAPGDFFDIVSGFRNWVFFTHRWLGEMAWRCWVPGNRVLLVTSLVSLSALLLLWRSNLLVFTPASDESEGGWKWGGMFGIIIAGLTFLGSTFSAFTKSLFIGTPDAADNYSLGSEDPLQYFKRHYNAYCVSLQRPVLVVIDDLDRCEPAFVTELLAGFQTVLASPRVIILLLGDKDWLEESFVQVNKAMKDIDVGPEHGFGARFVEKVIQLSITLPEMDGETRRSYLGALLGMTEEARKAEEAIPEDIRSQIDKVVRSTGVEQLEKSAFDTVEQLSTEQPSVKRETLERYVAREVSLKASTDTEQEVHTRHQLQGLACVLPPNPRQIKRIVNTVTLVAGIARAQFKLREHTPEWRKLARWIVLMTEWPQTWYTLTKNPEIVANLDLSWDTADISGDPPLQWAKTISHNDAAMALIVFKLEDGETDWPTDEPIDKSDIEWLAMIMPATSGSLLELPEKKIE